MAFGDKWTDRFKKNSQKKSKDEESTAPSIQKPVEVGQKELIPDQELVERSTTPLDKIDMSEMVQKIHITEQNPTKRLNVRAPTDLHKKFKDICREKWAGYEQGFSDVYGAICRG